MDIQGNNHDQEIRPRSFNCDLWRVRYGGRSEFAKTAEFVIFTHPCNLHISEGSGIHTNRARYLRIVAVVGASVLSVRSDLQSATARLGRLKGENNHD